MLGAFGIPIYDAKGFEADDVIGTIVEKMKNKRELDVIIASGDMDTLQLGRRRARAGVHPEKRTERHYFV